MNRLLTLVKTNLKFKKSETKTIAVVVGCSTLAFAALSTDKEIKNLEYSEDVEFENPLKDNPALAADAQVAVQPKLQPSVKRDVTKDFIHRAVYIGRKADVEQEGSNIPPPEQPLGSRDHWHHHAVEVFEARKAELTPYFRDERFYEKNCNMHQWYLKYPEDSYLRLATFRTGQNNTPFFPKWIMDTPLNIEVNRRFIQRLQKIGIISAETCARWEARFHELCYKMIGLTWAGTTADDGSPMYDFGSHYNTMLDGRGAKIGHLVGVHFTPDSIFDEYKSRIRMSEYQFYLYPIVTFFLVPLGLTMVKMAHNKQASGSSFKSGQFERSKIKPRNAREAVEWVEMEEKRDKYIATEMKRYENKLGVFSKNRLKLHTGYDQGKLGDNPTSEREFLAKQWSRARDEADAKYWFGLTEAIRKDEDRVLGAPKELERRPKKKFDF